MILVNNPGTWAHIYPPLRHAEWNGCTPTDLVFPFFLFIVGVSMAFSLAKRRDSGAPKLLLMAHVVRRSVILFLVGLSMGGFPDFRLIGPFLLVIAGLQLLFPDKPNVEQSASSTARAKKLVGLAMLVGGVIFFAIDFGYFHAKGLRVPGVLQRIAACYFLASSVVICFGLRGSGVVATIILIAYALVVAYVPAPDGYQADVTGQDGLLHDWLDNQVLAGHLYRERPDPEGLLSTLPATATVLLGLLTGAWLRRGRDGHATLVGLFVAANVCLFAGLCLDLFIPLNKKTWSSSYVIYTAGLALHVLAMCYWTIDVRGWRRWCGPLLVFGSNAIVVFVASSLTAKMSHRWHVSEGGPSVGGWLYQHAFASWAAPQTASLLYAISYVLLWLVLMYPLYRRRVFVRI
ncbi:MAG: DUF5009 domain-containing protein [Phycisphaerales bacterium]|nr:DUF5009 domain-containing protein [Phycisphaerales bacterium]